MNDISLTIDNIEVMKISQNSRYFGSCGFSAPFDYQSIFRAQSVTSPDGVEIQSHSLTDSSFFQDFNIGADPLDTVVDGSRRDRITYTGDLDIAGGAGLVSTHTV